MHAVRVLAEPLKGQAALFADRERAALAFTEAVTLLAEGYFPTEACEAVSATSPRTRSRR